MASIYSTRIGVLKSLTRRSFNSVLQKQVRKFAEMSSPLDKIPDVDIDANGVFKYILVEIHDDVNKQSKPIVRGYARCTWHDNDFGTDHSSTEFWWQSSLSP